jgi:glyoxylase I family protein
VIFACSYGDIGDDVFVLCAHAAPRNGPSNTASTSAIRNGARIRADQASRGMRCREVYAPGMRVHHLAFRTSDLARLERFYVDALGLALVRRQERSVWLDAAGTILMLELADASEAPHPAASQELVAFAIEPDTCALYTHRLAAASVAIEASTDFTLYFRDPDGRRIGLSSYPVPLTRS